MADRRLKTLGIAARTPVDPGGFDERTWEALTDIAQREATTTQDLLARISERGRSTHLLSATRIFVVEYYRSLLAETIDRDL